MSTPQEWMEQLNGLLQQFVNGHIALSTFQSEFRETYLGGSPAWELSDADQLFFDRVLETLQEVGMPGDRLHDDERLADARAYRAYLLALRDRHRAGGLTHESPEY